MARKKIRACRICRCTESVACIVPDGTCCWVGESLCSNPACIVAADVISWRGRLYLADGLAHPNGVINPPLGSGGYARRNVTVTMSNLVAHGLAVPSAHGDWYITQNGIAAVNVWKENNASA